MKSENSPNKFPIIILIHGAWHGAWCWEYFTPLLEQFGLNVIAPDLPGRNKNSDPISFSDQVEFICHLVQQQKRPVFLVGHSYGGVIASQVAENSMENICGIAYVSSFLLNDNQSLFDIAAENPTQLRDSLRFSGKHIEVNLSIAQEYFYNHCTPEVAQWAVQRLCAEPLKAMQTPIRITANRYGKIKKYYYLCEEDNATLPAFQEKMCLQFPEIEIFKLPSDHSPFLSHPKELAAHLIDVIVSSVTE